MSSELAINTNLIYLQNRLNISPSKLEIYQNLSTKEIIEAEAASGNPLAVQLAEELLNDVNALMQLFQMSNVQNRFIILRNMSSDQLYELLPLMEHEDLAQGLNYFDMDKLLELIQEIPAEQLVKTVLQMFSQEEVIEFMPEKQLDKFLSNDHLDKDRVLENLQYIPTEYIKQMLESITGEECKEDDDLIKQVGNLNPNDYKKALTNLHPKQKRQLILRLTKEDKRLYETFDASAYAKMIDEHKQKPELVEAMNVIETDEIIKMIKQLPEDLLSVVITQLDPEKLADNLMNKNPEIIAKLLAG